MKTIAHRLARELSARAEQVSAAIRLLDEGATVPFIARYRKEATGGLDDAQLRALEERLRYLRELDTEKDRVIAAIDEQGKLTPALTAQIRDAETKARLEDLYLPFKKRRRTKAQIAREAGLEPLLDRLLDHPNQDPEQAAAAFLDPARAVSDSRAALNGAKQILMERLSEDADLLRMVRERLRSHARLTAVVVEGQEDNGATFRDYFAFGESFATVPSHRVLAILRGREQGVLSVSLTDEDDGAAAPYLQRLVAKRAGIARQGRKADDLLWSWARLACRARIRLRCELALMTELRQRAERDAIAVFADNLRDLLLAAPAGPRVTMGLDPGIRTGVKVAVVDRTGKVVDTETVYPFPPKRDEAGAKKALAALIEKHGVELIAIGNGTASRETDRLAAQVVKAMPAGTRPTCVVVNEAGASVYSASALASAELPDLDVSLRGAASIARRLQDPLAELVKIEPRSIGVGQYQHDVSAHELNRSLDAVVEDCVNAVGVDLNTASPALLRRVSGLSDSLAQNIVRWRDQNGAFSNRKQLLAVNRLGPRTFEQCAGFLRIRDGDNPLDASSVHPEAYPVVQRIAERHRRSLRSLVGDARFLKNVQPRQFTDDTFGLPTVTDILSELEKPGRDPRPTFKTATFIDGIETMEDLKPGMALEGAVTNVTAFGAFVDIGVHQDGLVHISQLADRFIKDPREVVKTGQIVQVKVLSVDLKRKRIALTMRKKPTSGAPNRPQRNQPRRDQPPRPEPRRRGHRSEPTREHSGEGSLGELLRKAGVKTRR
ncbi:MAG: Tex family protein [Myxococcota bacterium]